MAAASPTLNRYLAREVIAAVAFISFGVDSLLYGPLP